jgi:hypothetical protein
VNSPRSASTCQNQEEAIHVMANFIMYFVATAFAFAVVVVKLLATFEFAAE